MEGGGGTGGEAAECSSPQQPYVHMEVAVGYTVLELLLGTLSLPEHLLGVKNRQGGRGLQWGSPLWSYALVW